MVRTLATCVALVLLFGAVVSAQSVLSDLPGKTNPPAVSDLFSSPDKLLQSLSNPDWHERRVAIHQLTLLGPAAEEAVKGLLRRNLDQEQRKNVGLALQLIQDTRLFGPSLITLHVKGASARDVISAIGEQSGAALPVYPSGMLKQDSWPKLTLDFDHVPFWQVMRELGNRLNIDYLSDSQEFRITSGPGRLPQGTITSGAFLLTARADGMRRGMTVELSVISEPKVTVLRTIDLKLDRAVDDQGNPLTSPSGRGGFGRGRGGLGGRGFGQMNRIQNGPRQVAGIFQKPPDSDKIGELRGQLTVCVLGGTARWEIADPLNMGSVTRTIDALPVTIISVSATGEGYLVRATVPLGWAGNDSQLNEITELMQRGLHLFDAVGHPLAAGTVDHTPGSETTDIEMPFSTKAGNGAAKPTGPPARFVWEVPEKTRDVTIPFQFKNIPINDPFN